LWSELGLRFGLIVPEIPYRTVLQCIDFGVLGSSKNCTVGDGDDILLCAKFQIEIYDFIGDEVSRFLLIFAWALKQSSANALPVIGLHQCPSSMATRVDHAIKFIIMLIVH